MSNTLSNITRIWKDKVKSTRLPRAVLAHTQCQYEVTDSSQLPRTLGSESVDLVGACKSAEAEAGLDTNGRSTISLSGDQLGHTLQPCRASRLLCGCTSVFQHSTIMQRTYDTQSRRLCLFPFFAAAILRAPPHLLCSRP